MGSALVSSEKAPQLPETMRESTLLTHSNTTPIIKQEQDIVSNIYSTNHQVQFNEVDDDDDDYYFDDEEEEEAQWLFERRMAALQDTKIATEALLTACTDLKQTVSAKVDALLQDLPDAHDPQFEKKYKNTQQQLLKLLPKKWNKSKQQTKKKT